MADTGEPGLRPAALRASDTPLHGTHLQPGVGHLSTFGSRGLHLQPGLPHSEVSLVWGASGARTSLRLGQLGRCPRPEISTNQLSDRGPGSLQGEKRPSLPAPDPGHCSRNVVGEMHQSRAWDPQGVLLRSQGCVRCRQIPAVGLSSSGTRGAGPHVLFSILLTLSFSERRLYCPLPARSVPLD